MFRNDKEISSGSLGTLVGCHHIQPYIPDNGAWFAVWVTPLNRDVARNTPLAIYFTDGSLYKKFSLFELFTEKQLEADIKKSGKIVCPPHLFLQVDIAVTDLGVTLQYRGSEKSIPILASSVLRMMLCAKSEDDVRKLLDALSDEDPKVREQAAVDLEAASLKHEALLRSALEQTQDSEVKARLEQIVKMIAPCRKIEACIRKNPEVLRHWNSDEAKTLYRQLTGK